ncbi:MAG: hypothetical protein U0559_04965 [Anaerolineae bacterium]
MNGVVRQYRNVVVKAVNAPNTCKQPPALALVLCSMVMFVSERLGRVHHKQARGIAAAQPIDAHGSMGSPEW